MNNSRIAPCDRLKIIIGELEYLQDLEYNISFGMSSYDDQVDGFSEVTKKLISDIETKITNRAQNLRLFMEKLKAASGPELFRLVQNFDDEAMSDTEDAQATEEKIYEHEAENVNDNTIEDYDEEAVSKTDDSQSTGEESNDHNVDYVNVESNTDITGPGPGDDVIQKIASTLASEDIDALKTVADEKKKSEDDYFRRTLLFSKMKFKHEESYYNFKHEESYYKTCIQVLKYYNLMSLFDRCEKFYVTQKGDIRLTFATRRECIFMLLQAKRTLQKEYKWGSKISVEIMCPRAELKKKMRLKYLGRQGKEQGKIHSYDVIQKKVQGFFVLKLRIYKRGVGYRVLNEDEIQTAIDNIEEFLPNNEE